jgi:(2R)-ethylmalonyl-CoA mutase
MGVAAVFTPKDFGLTAMMGQVVDVIRAARGLCSSRTAGDEPDTAPRRGDVAPSHI